MVKKLNKKGAIPLIVIIAGLLLAGALATGVISLGAISGSGDYIQRPVFKYVKCEASSELKYSEEYPVSSSGTWLNKPSSVESYNVKIEIKDKEFAAYYQVNYYVCNSKTLSSGNCRIYNQKESLSYRPIGSIVEINHVKGSEYVWVQYQKRQIIGSWKGSSGAVYEIGYIPFALREYDVLGGSSTPINPNDCSVPSNSDSWIDRFLSSDSSKINSEVSRNTNERVLQPNEVRWYVSGYVTSAEPSFAFTYKNQDAWCRPIGSSAEIYKINEVRLGSGTYKIASVDWSDKLGNEDCCPGDVRGDEVCNSKFQWESVKGSECGAFKSCGSPSFVPYSENKIIKYFCVNGRCQEEIKNVDCASDYDCKDSNQVCDLNKWECVDANVNIKGQVIKTVPDNQKDCEARGGTWITKTSEDKSLLNYIGIGDPKIVVQEYCKIGGSYSWFKIIILILIVLIVIWLLIQFVFPYLFPLIRGLIPI